MTAIQLRAELFRELNPIFDSEVAMQKALTALRDIRRMVFSEVPATKTTVKEGWSAAAQKAHNEGADQLVAADTFKDDISSEELVAMVRKKFNVPESPETKWFREHPVNFTEEELSDERTKYILSKCSPKR